MQASSFHVGSNMGSVHVNRGNQEKHMMSLLDDGAQDDEEVLGLRFE